MTYKSAMDRSSIKSTLSRKKNMTIEDFVAREFGTQFYDLVFKLSQEQQAEFEIDYNSGNSTSASDRKLMLKREKRFIANRTMLLDPSGFEMPFPSSIEQYPNHIKEIFRSIQLEISSDDIVALQEGETSDENIINVYFKVLQKVNLVLHRANDYLKMQATAGANSNPNEITELATKKVLYCNTNFIRDLKNCAPVDYDAMI